METHRAITRYFQDFPEKLEAGTKKVQVCETHISTVLLCENSVFKFKKPVDFGFISQAMPEQRLENCENEVSLNRRLSHDVYRGVRGVFPRGEGYELREETEGALDFCVEMKRLPEQATLKSLLAAGALGRDALEQVAVTLADFHVKCPRRPPGSELRDFPEKLGENLDTMTEANILDPDLRRRIEGLLAEKQQLIQARERGGHLIDGHGDLRLDHVYLLEGGVQVLDCVEFNQAFRLVDPLEDFAFLSMCFRAEGHDQLAEILTREYISSSADLGALPLLPLFEIYRASVRCKVDYLSIAQEPGEARVAFLRQRLEMYLKFIEQRLEESKPVGQNLRVMMGLPASGKSVAGRRLKEETNSLYFASDVVRKRMFGLGVYEQSDSIRHPDIYSPPVHKRVYDRLTALARLGARYGYDVILDATYSRQEHRLPVIKLAEGLGLNLEFHWMDADEAAIKERLAGRREKPGISELTRFEDWIAMRDKFEGFPGLSKAFFRVIRVKT